MIKVLSCEGDARHLMYFPLSYGRSRHSNLFCNIVSINDVKKKPRLTLEILFSQAALLQKRQAARMLTGVLRSSRRDLLARAMSVWKSVAVRRARLLKLSAFIVLRQRVFLLNRAWSRIVWAAGERNAARARKVCSGLSWWNSGVLTDGVDLPRSI